MASFANDREGIRLAEIGAWDSLIKVVRSDPKVATAKDHHGMLPLHWVCTEGDVPPQVIKALLKAFPESVLIKNNAQFLPIHIAVRAGASASSLKVLCDSRPSTMVEMTPSGKTALMLAKEVNLPPDAIDILQHAEQKYLEMNDDFGASNAVFESVKREIERQTQMLRESMFGNPEPSRASSSHQNPSEMGRNSLSTAGSLSAAVDPDTIHEDKTNSFNQPTAASSNRPSHAREPRSSMEPPLSFSIIEPRKKDSEWSRTSSLVREESIVDANEDGCAICCKRFSLFRKKYQCKACQKLLCHRHVAGKIQLPEYFKRQTVCRECYLAYNRMNKTEGMASWTAAAAGGAPRSDPHRCSTSSSSINTRTNAALLSEQRSHSMYSLRGSQRGSVPDLQPRKNGASLSLNQRPSGAGGGYYRRPRSPSSGRESDTADCDRNSAVVSALQYRLAILEEKNRALTERLEDQESQYNEAMLLLTQTMTRVAELELRASVLNTDPVLKDAHDLIESSHDQENEDDDNEEEEEEEEEDFDFTSPYTEKF